MIKSSSSIVSQSILTESLSARSQAIASLPDEKALLVLNKAKAAIQSTWQGAGLATVEEVAEFYEVGVEAIKSIVKKNASELKTDGAKKLSGKELQEVRSSLNLTSSAPHLWVFTPRAFIRIGFILVQSKIAAEVRTQSLNLIESIPQIIQANNEKTDRIIELELQIKLAEAHARAVEADLHSRQLDNSMLTMHGAPVVLALRGQVDQVVEINQPTIEVIDQKSGATFKGMTFPQLKEYLKKKYGVSNFKSGAAIAQFLESEGMGHLVAQTPRRILADYVPEENIEEVVRVILSGDRQLIIGE